MTAAIDFEALLRPRRIAVIGATERPDTWGHWMLRELLHGAFPGQVYAVNPRAGTVLGQPAYARVTEIPDPVDLAIVTVPAAGVFDVLRDCVAKGVKVALIVTAGFGEARTEGRAQEAQMVAYARAHGLRLIGPNVSGVINLHYGLKAHPADGRYLRKTPVTFICQGAYAITDIAAREASLGRGFGKFLHTGNEADVTVVDFLEYCEHDPETQAICLYIEGLRQGRRFLEVARRIAPHKPIVVFKAGVTPEGSRAAASHTGALAGAAAVYRGALRQAGVIQASHFELSLTLAHALLELPPLRQPTVGIVTLGGSWGVMLTDALAQHGLRVPELPAALQAELRRLGMPERASVRNPVDFGAAAGSISLEARLQIVQRLLDCDVLGAVVVHGYGAPGFWGAEAPAMVRQRLEEEKAMLQGLRALQARASKPLVLATAMTPLESQIVREMIAEGVRFLHRLDDVAAVLAALYEYTARHGRA
ncbi:MAG: acetyl-CoA synthetase [Candidatus Tectimicrobiota bacterium]|nr:MAG: acetyl-CoA synthetase [Candidatus Tectomicrobia bacterium]